MNDALSAKEQILTVDEVAKYLKVTSRSIYALLSKEEIPAFRVGSAWRFRKDEIDMWTRTSSSRKVNYDEFDTESLEQIISRIENDEIIKDKSRQEITRSFFSHPETTKSRIIHGVVETPLKIAKFIVNLAFERWCSQNEGEQKNFSELDWFDPCCGGGVFPEAILETCFDIIDIKDENHLPKITISEISLLGIFTSLQIIKQVLQRKRLSISKYLDSGRLKILYGDTLRTFSEKRELFETTEIPFDIVVGNPPYVRATSIDKKYKGYLKKNFPSTYSGNADLYTYFIVGSLLSLRPNGILSFISPAGFIRAKNSEFLRKWITHNGNLDTYFDLDETSVFPDADLHAAIYTITKQFLQHHEVNYFHVKNNKELDLLIENKIKPETRFIDQPKSHGWTFHKSELSKTDFENQFKQCISLEELGITVYSGIRPGLAEAYILDEDTYQKFSSEIKLKWFKPLVLPANINRWEGIKKTNYLLVIPSNINCLDHEILTYLNPFKDALMKRTEVSKNIQWFNLRPCTYYHKMEKPKIIFPDLSAQQRFSFDTKNLYIPDGSYFIETDDLTLLGILNSDLAKNYFVNRCSSVGNLNSRGRFRFKKTFVQNFPLPRHYKQKSETHVEISKIVQQIISKGEDQRTIEQLNKLIQNYYKEGL